MTDPTIASWSRESDLLFQLRQLREENERLRTALEQPEQPVQRPWVGLTEFQFAEIYNKWNDSNGSTPWGLYHAIEKALKAKNHG